MNFLKKTAGLLWMALALAALIFLVSRPGTELERAMQLGKPLLEIQMFWWIVLPIFTPILAGLALFGWYAWRGEYDQPVE